MVVKSLNDLSITIHEIGKRYNIQNYIDEFRTSMTNEVSQKFWDEFNSIRTTPVGEIANPLEKIMLLSSVISNEELEKVSKINQRCFNIIRSDNADTVRYLCLDFLSRHIFVFNV